MLVKSEVQILRLLFTLLLVYCYVTVILLHIMIVLALVCGCYFLVSYHRYWEAYIRAIWPLWPLGSERPNPKPKP